MNQEGQADKDDQTCIREARESLKALHGKLQFLRLAEIVSTASSLASVTYVFLRVLSGKEIRALWIFQSHLPLLAALGSAAIFAWVHVYRISKVKETVGEMREKTSAFDALHSLFDFKQLHEEDKELCHSVVELSQPLFPWKHWRSWYFLAVAAFCALIAIVWVLGD